MNFASKFFLTLSVVSLMMGCTKPDHGTSSGAEFYVTDMTASRSELQVIKSRSDWEVPKQAIYTFKACMKDRATQDEIRGHQFQVADMEGRQFDALSSTDTKGCFTWKENFSFNYFAAKTLYVPMKRKIIGTGVYSGERVVEFAINPWAVGAVARDKSEDFILLNDGARVRDQIPEMKLAAEKDALKVLNGDMGMLETLSSEEVSSDVARIWVSDVSLKTIKRRTLGDGITLDILLSMQPVLKLRSTDGNIVTKKISKGQFDVVAQLVVTDTGIEENKKMIITGNSPITSVARVDLDQLTTQMRASWRRRAHTGNVTLALMVKPKGVQGIEPFEGLFELGGIHSLDGGSSAKVLPVCGHPTDSEPGEMAVNASDKPCKGIVERFTKDADNYEELKKQGYASSNDPLIFDTMKLRFVSVLPGETATQRVVLYSASTCITNRFDGSKAADIPFIVEYLDDDGHIIPELSQSGPIKTDSLGCLKWNSTVHHAYYKPEHFIWHRVRIHTEKSKDNFMKVKRFALNPWDDKFTFGWDEEEFNEEFMKSKKAQSRFFLPAFGYHTVRFLYNIDPYMALEVKKTVLLDLKPRVLRYAGIVNARKQTEPLRDGIYLMKVAIQKDFLDPTERPIDLKTGEPVENAPNLQVGKRFSPSMGSEVPAVISKSLGKIIPREYITWDQSLVRVVDGHLIHPIELTMRDLRLMRVRSNFMIELQTVDERKIQTHDILNQQMQHELDDLRARRRAQEHERQLKAGEEGQEEQQLDLEELEAKAKQIRGKYKAAFYEMKQQLENQPFINNNFRIDPDLLAPIKEVLQVNDFTDVKLPSKDEADLNVFVEEKESSGLDRRTFVGPVIFLSNAYSDSMRATDNLDEAKCADIARYGQKSFIEGDADQELLALGKSLSLLAETEGTGGDEALKNQRQNKAYRYSRYYGALTHLCNKQVDELIADQKVDEAEYDRVMPVAASKENMIRTFGLDYLSMDDEPLAPIVPDECDGNFYCKNLRSRTLTKDHLVELLNKNMFDRAWQVDGLRYSGKPPQKVTKETLGDLLFPPLDFESVSTNGNPLAFKKDISDPMDIFTSCSLLTDLAVERLEILGQAPGGEKFLQRLGEGRLQRHRAGLVNALFRQCVSEQSHQGTAVVLDEKLKIFKTGTDYVFRGGLQLNINVGNSVSFGRSNGWSASMKLDDIPSGLKGAFTAGGALIGSFFGPGALVGAGAGFLVGSAADLGLAVIKPFGLGKSQGVSNSEGTSVSAGTYLVSQMAKFDVPLESFQRCRIIRFSDGFAKGMAENMGVHPYVSALMAKGFMACDRTVEAHGTSALRVPETYFYFTQHFTEGDMLDQADLYSHPWLLAMRGIRDFGTFVESIEAVETNSLSGFWSGLFSPEKKERSHSWPLDHMAVTYRNLIPTFPGFYTLTTYGESVTTFPLNDRFSMIETDKNGEVECHLEKSNRGSRPTCAEKLTMDGANQASE